MIEQTALHQIGNHLKGLTILIGTYLMSLTMKIGTSLGFSFLGEEKLRAFVSNISPRVILKKIQNTFYHGISKYFVKTGDEQVNSTKTTKHHTALRKNQFIAKLDFFRSSTDEASCFVVPVLGAASLCASFPFTGFRRGSFLLANKNTVPLDIKNIVTQCNDLINLLPFTPSLKKQYVHFVAITQYPNKHHLLHSNNKAHQKEQKQLI
ncbi:hypothetical protein [Legionella fallonii]|uniref:Uncharacterized protein n=1 Tax=Legionella fallonii LLAP-10 TaxID=1212491 RepID=A0A098G3X0_9GAMM|nr:hypothetical protein [Legionella fallonii]CEG57173.1 protein of unknown function [Legionella fallonii LLAP-10]